MTETGGDLEFVSRRYYGVKTCGFTNYYHCLAYPDASVALPLIFPVRP